MEKVLKYFLIPVHHAPFDTHLLSILYNEIYAYEWIAANFLHMQINTKDMVDNLTSGKEEMFKQSNSGILNVEIGFLAY